MSRSTCEAKMKVSKMKPAEQLDCKQMSLGSSSILKTSCRLVSLRCIDGWSNSTFTSEADLWLKWLVEPVSRGTRYAVR